MGEKLAPTIEPTLEKVRLQFETWQKAKKGNDLIPEKPWEADVDLTKTHSPHKITKTPGLNSMRLKIRVNASKAALLINKEARAGMDPALETMRVLFENRREGKGVKERSPELARHQERLRVDPWGPVVSRGGYRQVKFPR